MAAMYAPVGSVHAGSLADIDHVVLFMQENRAFDHYFGSMAGVRGYSDPNVQVNGNTPVWQQEVDSSLTTTGKYLNPWYLNYLGGDWVNATRCMVAGDNGYTDNHLSLNNDLNNHWALNNTPWSWGFFKRADLPVQHAIADGRTIGDMYQESVIASTNPNRVTWASGTINVTGGTVYIDNNETPGCELPNVDCYPLDWLTAAEIYEAEGVSWEVFQDADNFDDNPLAWFAQFQDASKNSSLYEKGFVGQTLDTFYAKAANGTLPEISYIIGPAELSEHPPYSPHDGAWFQQQIVDAVTSSPKYGSTALLISYDETGGFGDHVVPYHAPSGTAGEYIEDPFDGLGEVYTGPGFRVPFHIVSPWTRGGNVFVEHADHNSQLLFVEAWQAAKGKNVKTPAMEPWRREHMSNLVSAFDFDHPDYSLPALPAAPVPHTNAQGVYDGSSFCEATYPTQRPTVPYSGSSAAVQDVASLSEDGFKPVRGALTEGRFLVFEKGGYALADSELFGSIDGTKATAQHDAIAQRWVAHVVEIGGDQFLFSSAQSGRYISAIGTPVEGTDLAGVFTVSFVSGKGYSLRNQLGLYVTIEEPGIVLLSLSPAYFEAYSVTYSS